MAHRVRVGELLLAVEGLALARHLFGGDPSVVGRRIDAIRETLGTIDVVTAGGDGDDDDAIERFAVQLSEAGLADGYERWSSSYDEAENPLLAVEGPILRSLIEDVAPGSALDACIGTGRHAALLQRLGHVVTGVDQSSHMLALAAAKVPSALLVHGDIADPSALPRGDSYDLVVCALALTHFPTLAEPVAELAVRTRQGGRIVITDMHPMAVLLSGQALFNDERDGQARFVRNYVHQVSHYLNAFASAGLVVRRCVEHVLARGEGPMANLAGHLRPEATEAAYLGLPYVLAWSLEKL